MTELIQNRLQLAEEHLLKGDYGGALYHAYVSFVRSKIQGHLEAELTSWNLVQMAAKLALKEFADRVEQRDLTVTPDNILALMGEHSIHGTTFNDLLGKDLKEAIEKFKRTLEERLDGYWKKLGYGQNGTYGEAPKITAGYYDLHKLRESGETSGIDLRVPSQIIYPTYLNPSNFIEGYLSPKNPPSIKDKIEIVPSYSKFKLHKLNIPEAMPPKIPPPYLR